MLLFLFLLFPLAFGIWCRSRGPENFSKSLFTAALGVFVGAVFCAYKYFFSPFYFLTPDSFLLNFLYLFLIQTAVPLAVLTAAFLFVDKKESLSDRLENIFPLYAGFYAVYIVFRVLTSQLPFPYFYLFAKPALYLFMCLVLAKAARPLFVKADRALLPANKAGLFVAAFALALLLPAAIEALWILGVPFWATALLTLAYCFGGIFFLAL